MNYEQARELIRTFGPAWLVMIADVDVASIITGLQSGASWGYRMITVMLLLTVPLFVIQDVAGTLGTVSGMGLGEAIRRLYGRKVALLASAPMALTDVLEYVAEYAGIALGSELLGLPAIPILLAVFVLHIAVAWSGKYRHVEAALLPISFLLVMAIVASAVLVRPDPALLTSQALSMPLSNRDFDYLLAASVGSVIMPWMLFFHSGADARKGLRPSNLRAERAETIIGAVVSEILMAITVIVGALITVDKPGDYLSAKALMSALKPLGMLGPYVMGVGFIASGFLALVVISLASAWGVLEALSIRRGTDMYRLFYLLESVPAVIIVALSLRSLIYLMIALMVVYTVVLAPLLYLLGRIAAREDVMGEYRLRGLRAAAYWALSALVVATGFVALVY